MDAVVIITVIFIIVFYLILNTVKSGKKTTRNPVRTIRIVEPTEPESSAGVYPFAGQYTQRNMADFTVENKPDGDGCPFCGKSIKATNRFCPYCGYSLEEIKNS